MIRLVCFAFALAFTGQVDEKPLQITHRARAVAPGEVVLVEVRSPVALQEVRGEWLGHAVTFFSTGPQRWEGLAPIDLAARAGRQTLAVNAKTADGRVLKQSYPIVIAARVFPARKISVDPRFVDPPADALPRIEQERKTTEAIFAQTTAERFWKDPFVVPVPGLATSSFGRRTILNGQPRGQHSGTDFQAPSGTPVVAPNRGRVVLAADQYFAGQTIIIDHGLGVYSYLAHLSEFSVTEGTIVERGQKIALSGSSGRVTGPHLHWTMRLGSARVDPLSLVDVLQKEKGTREKPSPFSLLSGKAGLRDRRRFALRSAGARDLHVGCATVGQELQTAGLRAPGERLEAGSLGELRVVEGDHEVGLSGNLRARVMRALGLFDDPEHLRLEEHLAELPFGRRLPQGVA
jgi:murein DD-endopeptidase MepM/ murein hydrolase activator NlpD